VRVAALLRRQYDGRMGFGETIFLFLLALVIFGPKKLPEIARQVGKMLNEVKRASNEFKAQIEQEVTNLERDEARKRLPAAAAPEGAIVSRQLNGRIATSSDGMSAETILSDHSANQPPVEHSPVSDSPAESPAAGQESHG